VACTVHKFYNSKKPIAFYDTEKGSDYIARLIEEKTGMKPIRDKTRAFSDLMADGKQCEEGASDIYLIDSMTHVWRELGDAYMEKLNQGRRYAKSRMDIQDIMQVKKLWQPWVDFFLNSKLHIIVCGREGNDWGYEENEETGKRDLVAVGKKMKVEGEFGYEASLMVSMSAYQNAEVTLKKKGGSKEKQARSIVNVATVLKDRFDLLNGAVFEMPTGEEFMPFLERLQPTRDRRVDTDVKSHNDMAPQNEDQWAGEKRQRVVACEEIQGLMLKFYPGQSAREKALKAALVHRVFNTRSWTKVESLEPLVLRNGLVDMQAILEDPAGFEADVMDEMGERPPA
jgi:hypothetical protein